MSRLAVGLGILVIIGSFTASPQIAGAEEASNETLIVDGAGGAEYTSIQAAVDAADSGDTVRVRNGTYRENVVVDIGVTIRAPRGATLNGSTLGDATAFDIQDNATARIRGFTITGYQVGIDADYKNAANWALEDAVIRNTSIGIGVAGEGDWEIRNVSIQDTWTGIDATYSSGNWSVVDSSIRGATEGKGIDASPSSGDWTVVNSTIENVDFVSVSASFSEGDWRVVNSTIRNSMVGVGALEASGNWTITGTTIANITPSDRYDFWQPPLEEGAAIDAKDTNGSWKVSTSRFTNNRGSAIVATGAHPPGDARRNWWGDAAGPDADDCVGNVNCRDPLSQWPPESMMGGFSPTPTDQNTVPPTESGPRPDTTRGATTVSSSDESEEVSSTPQKIRSRPSVPRNLALGFGTFGLVALIALVVYRRA